ncbi:HEXDC Hexosaminidase, partial [Eudromia elegans]|nr:HEXDC Hexosaminidase [Eudromia elegans]
LRLVHLDLKGAAPRVSYLEQVRGAAARRCGPPHPAACRVPCALQLFPLLSQLGASGILLEYEDMFPFRGELETLRSPYAYSEEDVERIQQLAELNRLEVVPLVQTFGHAEVGGRGDAAGAGTRGRPLPGAPPAQYILKHDKYRHLREVERFPNSFNPRAPGTLPLLRSLLAQVMEKHGRSGWIHIGADEVFHLGEGAESRAWMSRTKGDVGALYLEHVKAVASAVAAPGRRALMWDDMLRRMSAGALRGERVPGGAAGPHGRVLSACPPPRRVGHRPARLARRVVLRAGLRRRARGYVGTWVRWRGPCTAPAPLTGPAAAGPFLAKYAESGFGAVWYDHYAVLCELLPVGVPSLALCLQTLANGGFTEATKRRVLDALGFHSIHLEQSTCEGTGAFPGAQIYRLVEQVNGHLKESVAQLLEEESAVKGWFSPYHRRRRFGNPRNLESFGSRLLKLHEDWQAVERSLRAQLAAVYFPDTVDEWLEENVSPYLEPLRELLRDYR